jgi:hypothetical protein
MRSISYIWLALKAAVAISLVFLSTSILFGQEHTGHSKNYSFCSGEHSNGDRAGFKELREMTIPASGSVSVDGGKNGSVRVRGENRADILVRACVQAWANSADGARAVAQSVRVSTAGTIKADNGSTENWAVSFEVLVPRNTDLNLRATNGGVSIAGVEGNLEFETTNGGVNLQEIAGNVKGRTTNGGVKVLLSGNGWKGSGLDVQTSNGGVQLTMPENYAANIETGTVNGGFTTDIVGLDFQRDERQRAVRINTPINGGGAPVRVTTTNGGVRITAIRTAVQ